MNRFRPDSLQRGGHPRGVCPPGWGKGLRVTRCRRVACRSVGRRLLERPGSPRRCSSSPLMLDEFARCPSTSCGLRCSQDERLCEARTNYGCGLLAVSSGLGICLCGRRRPVGCRHDKPIHGGVGTPIRCALGRAVKGWGDTGGFRTTRRFRAVVGTGPGGDSCLWGRAAGDDSVRGCQSDRDE